MSGPWEKYGGGGQPEKTRSGPWEKYGGASSPSASSPVVAQPQRKQYAAPSVDLTESPGLYEAPDDGSLNVAQTAGMLGRQVSDAVTHHLPAAVAAGVEGAGYMRDNNWTDNAGIATDFQQPGMDLSQEKWTGGNPVIESLIQRGRERERQGVTGNDANIQTAIPGISRQDIQSLGPSTGQSLGSMGAALLGGPPALALSTSSMQRTTANRMLRDTDEELQAEYKQRTGLDMPIEMRKELLAQIEGKANESGFWEAVPEQLGDVAAAQIMRMPFAGWLTKTLGRNLATRIVSKWAGMQIPELATETVTQMGQGNVEVEARKQLGISRDDDKTREWTNPSDLLDSAKEVAGPTMLQTTLFGMGGGTVNNASRIADAVRSRVDPQGHAARQFANELDNTDISVNADAAARQALDPNRGRSDMVVPRQRAGERVSDEEWAKNFVESGGRPQVIEEPQTGDDLRAALNNSENWEQERDAEINRESDLHDRLSGMTDKQLQGRLRNIRKSTGERAQFEAGIIRDILSERSQQQQEAQASKPDSANDALNRPPATREAFGYNPDANLEETRVNQAEPLPASDTTEAPVLQNRNRSTPQAIQQMSSIASDPDYGRLSVSRDFANGAPVVFGDTGDAVIGNESYAVDANGRRIPVQYAVVEAGSLIPSNRADGTTIQEYENGAPGKMRAIAGNGRVAGLQEAYRRGTAGNYFSEMAGDVDHGVPADVINGMRQPVLVRIMPESDVTPDIGDVSNTSGTAALSPLEQAQNDARRINISAIEFGESGISPRNVRHFVSSMPIPEQVGLLTPDGQPTRQAYDRMMAAIFHSAYGNQELVGLYSQENDPEARTILTGMAEAAPRMAQLEGAGAFDIRDLITEAAQAAVNARRRGERLADYGRTQDIERSRDTDFLIDFFARNVRSANRIGQGLSNLADTMFRASQVQNGLFGDVITRDQAIQDFRNRNGQGTQEQAARDTGNAGRPVDVEQRPAGQENNAKRRAGVPAASQSESGNQPGQSAESGFQLEQPTAAQLREQEASREAESSRQQEEEREAARREQEEAERRFIESRQGQSAENFTLGQSTEDAIAGQDALFSRSPSKPKNRVTFTGNELGGMDLPINQLKVRATIYARQHFAGKTVRVASDGADIIIGSGGIKKAMSQDVSPVAAIVTSKLDSIIENGEYVGSSPDEKKRNTIKAVHYYDTPVNIGGKDHAIRIVVRENPDGKRYYDHFEIRDSLPARSAKRLTGEQPGLVSGQPKQEGSVQRLNDTAPVDSNISENAENSKQSQGDTLAKRRKKTIDVDGVRHPTTNSNGQPIASSDEAIENFWRWFGDSKVVDRHGRPQVVYHGSLKGGFDVFNTKGRGISKGSGAFFSSDRKIAETYSDSNHEISSFSGKGTERGIYSAYIKLENPYEIDANHNNWGNINGDFEYFIQDDEGEDYGSFSNKSDAEFELSKIEEENPSKKFYLTEDPAENAMSTNDAGVLARKNGNDGVIVRNVMDHGTHSYTEYADSFIVFNPNQIKSAIRNTGEFSQDNPSILAKRQELMFDTPSGNTGGRRSAKLSNDMDRLSRKLQSREITADQFDIAFAQLLEDINSPAHSQDFTSSETTGNVEKVRAFLEKGKRSGRLNAKGADFLLWVLDRNPNIANRLNVRISQPTAATAGIEGLYTEAQALMDIIEGQDAPNTKVHEVMHHAEKMMPQNVQRGIITAYKQAFQKAWKSADPETRILLEAMVKASAGNAEAKSIVNDAFDTGELSVNDYYHLVNPSEFWAVKATDILSGRYQVQGSWVNRARKWLAEFIEYIRNALGLQSDAAVLRGLRSVLDGDGTFVSPFTLAAENQMASRAQPIARNTAAPVANRQPQINVQGTVMQPTFSPVNFTVSNPGTFDDLIRALQNNRIDLKRLQDAIHEAGGVITEDVDAYLSDELAISRTTHRLDEFAKDTVMPILDEMHKAKLTIDQVNEYLYARHAPERNRQLRKINPGQPNNDALSGMSDSDAAAIMSQWQGNRAMRNIAQLVDRMTKQARDNYVQSGILDRRTVQAWESVYDHYVPLMRDVENVERKNKGPKIFKRSLGSTKEATNILANAIAGAEQAIIQSERVKVQQTLLNMAEAFPNKDFWSVDDPELERSINENTGLVEWRIPTLWQRADNVVPVKVNGKDRYVVFNKNNPRAMKVAQAMNGGDMQSVEALNKATGLLGPITRYLSMWTTSRNPVFMLFNFQRDVQHAVFNIEDTPIAGKQAQVAKNLFPAIRGYWQMEMEKGNPNNPAFRYAQEFKEAGAETGYVKTFDTIERHVADLQKQLDQMNQHKADPRRLARGLVETIDSYNNVIENGVRLSVYMTARENGVSVKRAASIAKNITVNFNRRGNMSSAVNNLYMFFNANVQGHARFFRAVIKSKRARYIAGSMLAMGFVMDIVNRAVGGDDDETGLKRYDQIPDFEKARNWIFMIPGTNGAHIKIPMPQGLHVLPNMGRMISEIFFSSKPQNYMEKLWEATTTFAEAFSPTGSAGSFSQFFMPSAIKPLAQLGENKSFTGGPVYREKNQFGYSAPAYARHFRNTPGMWTDASKLLNDLAGGDKITPGWINVPPEAMRLMFTSYVLPGVAQLGDRGATALGKFMKGEELTPREIPVVQRMIGIAPEERTQEQSYYQEMRRMDQLIGQMNKYEQEGSQASFDKYRDRLREMGDGNEYLGAERFGRLTEIKGELTSLNRDIAEAEAFTEFSDDPDIAGRQREAYQRILKEMKADRKLLIRAGLNAMNLKEVR